MFNDKDFSIVVVENGEFLEKAKALRHLAFFNEKGSESDKFDHYCKHLVIIENKTKNVVGTYRLLLGASAAKNNGFYSETMFDISYLKNKPKGEILEIGRACVYPGYRKFRILPLLLRGVLSFVDQHDIKYVIGSTALDDPTPDAVGNFMRYLDDQELISRQWKVRPLQGKEYSYSAISKVNRSFFRIPTLIRGYARMGALVCGEPAWESHFSNVVFFMMIDTGKMNAAYKSKFVKNYSEAYH
jgi:putative hemolysin